MTEREAQAEALWTYTISQEKTLRRLVKKGYMSQEEADRLSNLLYEQLNTDDIAGFRISHLGEIMRAQSVSIPCQCRIKIVRKRRTNFVVFRRW